MESEKTEKTETVQGAAQGVKVYRCTYEKTHTQTASVYVAAKSKEEAEAFLKTLTDEQPGYDLETDIMRNRYDDCDDNDEWELSNVESESENIEDHTVNWDYEDVCEALNLEEED
jgi:transcriptional regulator of met regulon